MSRKKRSSGAGEEFEKAQALTGMSHKTIMRGMQELEVRRSLGDPGRVRQPGGGRKMVEDKYPGIEAALEQMLAHEIAGDPMTEQRWVRSSLRQLSEKAKRSRLSSKYKDRGSAAQEAGIFLEEE